MRVRVLAGALVAVLAAAAAPGCDELPPACDLATPWPRHTIANDGLVGADGVSVGDIDGDGDLDVVSGWEQSERVTLSLHPDADEIRDCDPWPTVRLPVYVGQVEDVIFADVDADGQLDVISATETGMIHLHFPPADRDRLLDTRAWTTVELTAATHLQRWMQLAHADLDGDGRADIIAGGRIDNATVGYFTSATPRDGTSWTYHAISPVGWTMSLVPDDVDGDGDIDVVLSDRQWVAAEPRRYDLIGSRWLLNDVRWVSNEIYHPHDEGMPKYLEVAGNRVIDGTSSEHYNLTTLRTTTDWRTWTATPIPQPPGVGLYHDVELGDIDGDGRDDLVFTYSAADGPLIGVLALRDAGDGTWLPEDISGAPGTKFDNVVLDDVDGDGDLDAITSEQIDQLGVVWYENPRPVAAPASP